MSKYSNIRFQIIGVMIFTLLGNNLIAGKGKADPEQTSVQFSAKPAKPFLMADKIQTTYIKVGLTGAAPTTKNKRTPINVAIVLDKSSSMGVDKMERAKEAAKTTIDLLDADDIISIVAYDNTITVLVPATKVSDKASIKHSIDQIRSGGSTALFAGVAKGAGEVRKFLDKNRVNRIILLSDGQANQGPSSPAELGELGSSLIKEGISVTTLGLGTGYNEDLMTKLAFKSDGNHYFAENEDQLVSIFQSEFRDVMSVVANQVNIHIECGEGVRPIRFLGREAEISGNSVHAKINQIYDKQEKYVLLEVELTPGAISASRQVAKVDYSYLDSLQGRKYASSDKIFVAFTDDEAIVAKHTNKDVMIEATLQIATAENQRATKWRDEGNIEKARKILTDNARYLKQHAQELESKTLESYWSSNVSDANNLAPNKWAVQRKSMRAKQTTNTLGQLETTHDPYVTGKSKKTNK